MEPFTDALKILAEVMRQGAASHPDNDWLRRGRPNIICAARKGICGYGTRGSWMQDYLGAWRRR
jgi:hypothetical protein